MPVELRENEHRIVAVRWLPASEGVIDRQRDIVAVVEVKAARIVNQLAVHVVEQIGNRVRERQCVALQFQIQRGVEAMNAAIAQEIDKVARRLDRLAGRAPDLLRQQDEIGDRRVDGKRAAIGARELVDLSQPDRVPHKYQHLALTPRMHGDEIVIAALIGAERLPERIVGVAVQIIRHGDGVLAVRYPEAVLDVSGKSDRPHRLVRSVEPGRYACR